MITFNLTGNTTSFTTTKNLGRDEEKLCAALNIPRGRFARPHQIHGVRVQQLHESDFAQGHSLSPYCELMEGMDAVIYDVRNACIGISTADCIPVICYDPEHHCAAAIHAGWKGTVQRIVEKTIDEMVKAYNTNPTLLHCAIGPGISLQSFEVGDEVYKAFEDAGFTMSTIAQRYAKWHLDLKECNRQQLITAGVSAENIQVSPIDTMTDERFYSARREGAGTGRILSGIILH